MRSLDSTAIENLSPPKFSPLFGEPSSFLIFLVLFSASSRIVFEPPAFSLLAKSSQTVMELSICDCVRGGIRSPAHRALGRGLPRQLFHHGPRGSPPGRTVPPAASLQQLGSSKRPSAVSESVRAAVQSSAFLRSPEMPWQPQRIPARPYPALLCSEQLWDELEAGQVTSNRKILRKFCYYTQ